MVQLGSSTKNVPPHQVPPTSLVSTSPSLTRVGMTLRLSEVWSRERIGRVPGPWVTYFPKYTVGVKVTTLMGSVTLEVGPGERSPLLRDALQGLILGAKFLEGFMTPVSAKIMVGFTKCSLGWHAFLHCPVYHLN
jgi:hypothetical protein